MTYSNDLETRRIKYKQMYTVIDEWIHANRSQISSAIAVRDFVEATKNVDLPIGDKFATLVGYLTKSTCWNDLCEIFQIWIEMEPDHQHHGTYAVWYTIALDYAQREDVSIEDRKQAADCAIEVLGHGVAPSESAEGALAYGRALYHHPNRATDQDKYSADALRWLNLAFDLTNTDKDNNHLLECIEKIRSEIYIGQERWSEALRSLIFVLQSCDDSERDSILKSVEECKAKIIEQGSSD